MSISQIYNSLISLLDELFLLCLSNMQSFKSIINLIYFFKLYWGYSPPSSVLILECGVIPIEGKNALQNGWCRFFRHETF